MPVVINELEVVAPPPSQQEVRQTPPQNLPTSGIKPEDIRAVIRKFAERRLRLHAT